jgi:hypothetical protein
MEYMGNAWGYCGQLPEYYLVMGDRLYRFESLLMKFEFCFMYGVRGELAKFLNAN